MHVYIKLFMCLIEQYTVRCMRGGDKAPHILELALYIRP